MWSIKEFSMLFQNIVPEIVRTFLIFHLHQDIAKWQPEIFALRQMQNPMVHFTFVLRYMYSIY